MGLTAIAKSRRRYHDSRGVHLTYQLPPHQLTPSQLQRTQLLDFLRSQRHSTQHQPVVSFFCISSRENPFVSG